MVVVVIVVCGLGFSGNLQMIISTPLVPYVLYALLCLMMFSISVTLHDIVHTDKSLTLVFEYLERDLKQYMDDCGAILAMNNVKLFLYQVDCLFDVQPS